ncbi:MAG: cytochrome P460 family protein [Nitrospirae bacterium]|nr:cytochrome P460 family protein [Nitrospirota bacterium]
MMVATSYQPPEESIHEPAPNGLTIPEGYRNWPVISVTHRVDNDSMRAILGNDVAREAIEKGTTKPWPDNATFVKVSWKAIKHENWNTAFVPGDFIQLEVMKKDSKKYAETGGWGFARWRGTDLKPYGKDATFVQECFGCHTPVKDRDYVYTKPPSFPR